MLHLILEFRSQRVNLGHVMLMLVEDDVALSQLLTWELEAQGYQLVTANSLAEARWVLAHQILQAVILDFNLPDGLGIDLVPEIQIPVIVISASTEFDIKQRAVAAGAFAFMHKPVRGEQLLGLLRRALAESPPREE